MNAEKAREYVKRWEGCDVLNCACPDFMECEEAMVYILYHPDLEEA